MTILRGFYAVTNPQWVSLTVLMLLVVAIRPVHGQSVTVVDGDVYFRAETSTTPRRLTEEARVIEAVLAPDHRTVALVRRTPGVLIDIALGPEEATELWVIRVDGTDPKRLVRGKSGSGPESTLAGLISPQFSPDGRRVYFLSRAWVTSHAVHVVTVDSTLVSRSSFAPAAPWKLSLAVSMPAT